MKNLLLILLVSCTTIGVAQYHDKPDSNQFYIDGLASLKKGDKDGAVKAFEQVPKEHNDYYEAMVLRVELIDHHEDFHHYKETLEEAVSELKGVKQYGHWEEDLGTMYFFSGEYEKSLALYQKALVDDQFNSKARNEMARVLIKLERYDEAIEDLEKCLFKKSNYKGWKGIALYKTGKPKEALPLLQASIAEDADEKPFIEFYHYLALCLKKTHHKEDICPIIDQAEELLKHDDYEVERKKWPDDMKAYIDHMEHYTRIVDEDRHKFCDKKKSKKSKKK